MHLSLNIIIMLRLYHWDACTNLTYAQLSLSYLGVETTWTELSAFLISDVPAAAYLTHTGSANVTTRNAITIMYSSCICTGIIMRYEIICVNTPLYGKSNSALFTQISWDWLHSSCWSYIFLCHMNQAKKYYLVYLHFRIKMDVIFTVSTVILLEK